MRNTYFASKKLSNLTKLLKNPKYEKKRCFSNLGVQKWVENNFFRKSYLWRKATHGGSEHAKIKIRTFASSIRNQLFFSKNIFRTVKKHLF